MQTQKETLFMNPITNKEQQVTYLKERLEIFLEVLDAIDPETTDLEDIDRLIKMMDDLEEKMEQFQGREEKE
jgi:ribosome biogenesis GTPase A